MANFSGAGTNGFFWIVPPGSIIENIKKMRRASIRNFRKQLDAFAKEEVEPFMKSNHPWSNRTGTAEDSLTAETSGADGSSLDDVMDLKIGYDLNILLSHPDGRKRDYSVYLEGYLGLGILNPTERIMFPQFLPKLSYKLTL